MGRFRESSSRNHERLAGRSEIGARRHFLESCRLNFRKWGLTPSRSRFLPRSEFDEPASQTARDRFGSRRNAQLSENGVDVKLDRVFRDVQLLRNVFIAETVRQQSKDFALARSQLLGERFIL